MSKLFFIIGSSTDENNSLSFQNVFLRHKCSLQLESKILSKFARGKRE